MKEYLGNAIYAEFDGYHVVLTTSNGIEDTNLIRLEPVEASALVRYVKGIRAKHVEHEPSTAMYVADTPTTGIDSGFFDDESFAVPLRPAKRQRRRPAPNGQRSDC